MCGNQAVEGGRGVKSDALSLRQITVLTVTGLLAPGADLLPGLLTRQAGRAGWLAPLLVLPVVLVWLCLLCDLFKEEGSCLGGLLKQGFGPVLGRVLILLYIMWAVVLAGGLLSRASARLGAVYENGMGRWLAGLALLLVLWMVWGKAGGLCRAAEIFWLAMAVTVAAVLLLSLPQLKGERLLPAWEEWKGVPGAWVDCLGVLGGAVFAAALAGKAPRREKSCSRLLGWGAAVCLLLTALAAAVVGQVGAELTGKLEHPFFIMVQGLSLEGGFARLEAPVAALWLLADFAGMGLLLLAVRTLAGERAGKWTALLAALAAAVGQGVFSEEKFLTSGGLVLGFGVPFLLWVVIKWKRRKG